MELSRIKKVALVYSLDLILAVALIHIFSAVIWIGGNFFELMTLVPAIRKNSSAVQDEIATTVPLQEHKNSAIAATLAIVSGPVLAYLYSNGNFVVFLKTSWGNTVLAAAIFAIILYVVGWYAGSLRVKIAELTKLRIQSVAKSPAGSQALATSENSEMTFLNVRLKNMIYLENALGALVLALMIVAGTI